VTGSFGSFFACRHLQLWIESDLKSRLHSLGCCEINGFSHASLVCQAVGQADIQSLLCRVVVGGGFGVVDGASGLTANTGNSLSIFRWRGSAPQLKLNP